jgi:glycosyltransferase involved in cell wall biosynthesis
MQGTHVHIYPSTMENESRILKITESLIAHGLANDIMILGLLRAGLPVDERWDAHRRVHRLEPKRHLRVPRGKSPLFYAEWYAQAVRAGSAVSPTLVHSNGLFDLPAAVMLKRRFGCPLVYDAHEFETERHGFSPAQKMLARVAERFLIRWADEVIVVGDSIADWYRAAYKREISVVRNKPKTVTASSGKVAPLRERLGITGGQLFLCHGALQSGRSIPALIDAFSRLSPDRHLVFAGYGPFVGLIQQAASTHSNIHYLSAVPPNEVVEMAASADVGLSVYEDSCLSYYYCVPNKLFEYEAAGLPIVVSDFPEMSREIDKWGNGWRVKPRADDVATLIGGLTPDEIALKGARSKEAAVFATWETEEKALLDAYRRITSRR